MDTPHNPPHVVIDVVSDVVCPWCYLGKHRLEQALASIPEIQATVRWHPFMLDPTTPPEGVDRREYFTRKFGSVEAVEPAHRRLVEMGSEIGIDYRFEDITRTPNTLDAHRVVRWAGEIGRTEAMVERLFRAYFTEGVYVGDRAELVRLAGEVGLDAAEIDARLASDRDKVDIEREIETAGEMGVTGVPCFIIDGRYAVMGAHESETLAGAIRKAVAERNEPAASR
jgi:predicted DsbA family dithiol-disulfide isomerase